jgi:hypothetical protein
MFDSWQIQVEFVVDKVTLGQVLLRVLLFSPIGIIPPFFHTFISLLPHGTYIILTADNVITITRHKIQHHYATCLFNGYAQFSVRQELKFCLLLWRTSCYKWLNKPHSLLLRVVLLWSIGINTQEFVTYGGVASKSLTTAPVDLHSLCNYYLTTGYHFTRLYIITY